MRGSLAHFKQAVVGIACVVISVFSTSAYAMTCSQVFSTPINTLLHFESGITKKDLKNFDKMAAALLQLRERISSVSVEEKFNMRVDFQKLYAEEMIARLEHSLRWNYRSPRLAKIIPSIRDENDVVHAGPFTVAKSVEFMIHEARLKIQNQEVTFGWFNNFSMRFTQVMDHAYGFRTAFYRSEEVSPLVRVPDSVDLRVKLDPLYGPERAIIASRYVNKDGIANDRLTVALPLAMNRAELGYIWALGINPIGILDMPQRYDGNFRTNLSGFARHDYGHIGEHGSNAFFSKRKKYFDSLTPDKKEELSFFFFVWDHEMGSGSKGSEFSPVFERVFFRLQFSSAKQEGDIPKLWADFTVERMMERYFEIEHELMRDQIIALALPL